LLPQITTVGLVCGVWHRVANGAEQEYLAGRRFVPRAKDPGLECPPFAPGAPGRHFLGVTGAFFRSWGFLQLQIALRGGKPALAGGVRLEWRLDKAQQNGAFLRKWPKMLADRSRQPGSIPCKPRFLCAGWVSTEAKRDQGGLRPPRGHPEATLRPSGGQPVGTLKPP
jgi:hypothetical protein